MLEAERRYSAGIIMVLASAVSYGLTPFFSSKSYEYGFESASLLCVSNLIAAILLLPVLISQRESIVPRMEYRKDLIMTGFFVSAATFVLYQSYFYLPVGVATSIHFCYPLFVMGGECIFYKKKFCRHDLWSAVLTVTGLMLMPEWGSHTGGYGIILALLSGIFFAGYVLRLNRSQLGNMHWSGFAFWMAVMKCLSAAAIFPMLNEGVPQFTGTSILMAAAVALTSSIVAVPLFKAGCRRVGETNAALMSLMEPIVSIMTGIVFLNEHITAVRLSGCVLVLGAAAFHTAAEIAFFSRKQP